MFYHTAAIHVLARAVAFELHIDCIYINFGDATVLVNNIHVLVIY